MLKFNKMKNQNFTIGILFLIMMSVQSIDKKHYKSIYKGYFNMRGLALIAAIITKFEGDSNIVDIYKNLAVQCVSLSNSRVFDKLKLLANEFHRVYYSFRKIDALNIITKNDKKIRKLLCKDHKEISIINVNRIKKNLNLKLKGLSTKNNKSKFKKLLFTDKISDKKLEMKKFLEKMMFRAFKLVFSTLTDCKLVPKKLRRFSKKLIKNKAQRLKKIMNIREIKLYMINGLNRISSNFDWMKIKTKPYQIITELNVIANMFVKFTTK